MLLLLLLLLLKKVFIRDNYFNSIGLYKPILGKSRTLTCSANRLADFHYSSSAAVELHSAIWLILDPIVVLAARVLDIYLPHACDESGSDGGERAGPGADNLRRQSLALMIARELGLAPL